MHGFPSPGGFASASAGLEQDAERNQIETNTVDARMELRRFFSRYDRRLPRGHGPKRPALAGPLPRAQLQGLLYQGKPVRCRVSRASGVHPILPNTFFWVFYVSPGISLFNGWFSPEEVQQQARDFVAAAALLDEQAAEIVPADVESEDTFERLKVERRPAYGGPFVPLLGPLPKIDKTFFAPDGQRISMVVHRRRGMHRALPGVYYWAMRHGRKTVYSAWLSLDEATTLVSEISSGRRPLPKPRK